VREKKGENALPPATSEGKRKKKEYSAPTLGGKEKGEARGYALPPPEGNSSAIFSKYVGNIVFRRGGKKESCVKIQGEKGGGKGTPCSEVEVAIPLHTQKWGEERNCMWPALAGEKGT